jgi:SAM-dependent methyltransferase
MRDARRPRDKDCGLRAYYERRAREYEGIYRRDDPIRQAEQAVMADALRAAMAGRRVLEIACGTGYWTSVIAEVARHVLATDVSEEMLDVARDKELPADKVEFGLADAFKLAEMPDTFDAGVAMFWISHVPKDRMKEFLGHFHARLIPNSVVFLADSVYVPGIGGELASKPGSPDTFKRRSLADGSQHEVLKNYYDANQLRDLLAPWATKLKLHFGTSFWRAEYTTSHEAPEGANRLP